MIALSGKVIQLNIIATTAPTTRAKSRRIGPAARIAFFLVVIAAFYFARGMI